MYRLHIGIYEFPFELFDCSSWKVCSTDVLREDCTFDYLSTQVLQSYPWSQLKSNDLNQQRYREAINSLHNLCNDTEPGTNSLLLLVITILH